MVPSAVVILPNMRLVLIALGGVILVIMTAYGSMVLAAPPQLQTDNTSNESVTINGAGATLAYPLLSLITAKYTETHPKVQINYQPIGSTGGVQQFTIKTVDFGATYPPMTGAQRSNAHCGCFHIPEAISALAMVYNLPGVHQRLNLDGPTLARMYLGTGPGTTIFWNDTGIANLNPGLNLPGVQIQPVHQEEGDGTTFVFTGFLSLTSPDWAAAFPGGGHTIVSFPVGLGVPGSTGVASLVSTTPYAIGYVELSYALTSNLAYAAILNPAGNFILPSEETAKAADEQLNVALPSGDGDWSKVVLLNEPGPDAYPLVTFTYIIVYEDLSTVPFMDLAKAKALVDFLWYTVHDGQNLGGNLQYVPLTHDIVTIDEVSIRAITFNGQQLTSN